VSRVREEREEEKGQSGRGERQQTGGRVSGSPSNLDGSR